MLIRKFLKKACFAALYFIIGICAIIAVNNIPAVRVSASDLYNTSDNNNKVAKVADFNFQTKEQIISTINTGIDNPYSAVSQINEFWGADGNYHIVYSGEYSVYISVLNEQMQLLRTLEIPKDLPIVGNAIQDDQGNYYIVYGKYDTADMNTDSSAGTAVVMSILQYNSNGEKLTGLSYTGNDTCPYDGSSWGTKEPFNFGNCDLLIDSTGTLICRYGRVMYNGHQSSHALYVNTATMSKLYYAAPYNSHSFDQKLIETSDGGYLFVDRGDGYDRGFVVFKMFKSTDKWEIPSFTPFHFSNGYIYQTTYAVLGGISECTNGYALAGVSEKTLSYNKAENSEFNESRNVFLQVFSKNFTSDSSNQPEVQLLTGEARIAEGTYLSGTGNCEDGARDYGILWLTDYSGNTYASNPKMINIGNDQLLLMWEKKEYKGDYDYETYDDYEDYLNQYIESCYMVVSSNGTIIIPETTIQDLHLTEFGEPSYRDGSIYWTTSNGENQDFIVHRLTIGETMAAKVHVTSIKVDQDTILATAGKKTQIKVKFYPEDAENKNLRYEEYEEDLIAIDKDGFITVKDTGSCELKIVSEDNKSIYTLVTVIASDNSPTNLKAVQVAPDYYDYSVKLTWKKSIYGSEYEIYRSTSKDKGYQYIDTAYNLYYYDNSITAGKKYYYKVKAALSWWDDEENQNPYSDTVMIYVVEQPQSMTVNKASKTSAKLNWSKAKSADGYEIYCYDKQDKKYVLLKSIQNNTETAFTKTNMSIGQTYLFKVRAFKTIEGVTYHGIFSEIVKIKL